MAQEESLENGFPAREEANAHRRGVEIVLQGNILLGKRGGRRRAKHVHKGHTRLLFTTMCMSIALSVALARTGLARLERHQTIPAASVRLVDTHPPRGRQAVPIAREGENQTAQAPVVFRTVAQPVNTNLALHV